VTDSRFSSADVRAYYDANTAAFVRHGQGGHVGSIHRAVWGPGVTNREQAFRYVEDLIVGEIDALGLDRPVRVLDLGCGIGASLTYLAQHRPIHGTGVTLSPVQARVGSERVTRLNLGDRVRILEGDYNALPRDLVPVDLAYAIESFVHGPSPAGFFSEAARALRPGGLLILCDDVRTAAYEGAAAVTLARFARGWHVNSLLTPEEWQVEAERAGLTRLSLADLSGWLELGRPRDRAIAILARALAWLPVPRRLAPLVGGAALQKGLAKGWISYQLAIFRRNTF
jgi:cyclopropane fatty-acyl-phospholipid synthase-like methyltransferase